MSDRSRILSGWRALFLAMAGAAMLAPHGAQAQPTGDSPDRYIDSYSLPGVRKNPRPRREQRCVEQMERFYGRDGIERMDAVTICDDSGITIRSMGSGAGMGPYGAPPVGGNRGFGGADTR